MPTTPEQVRTGLQLVTSATESEFKALARSIRPASLRAALFEAAPLVVSHYTDGAAALALDWYDERRDLSAPTTTYTPSPVTLVREDFIGNTVAWATDPLTGPEPDIAATILRLVPALQREVANGFWGTVTENSKRDRSSGGWRRIARPGACAFCRMLADKGAVYSESTVRFAAHKGKCHCVAEPVFGNHGGPPASAMQYVASKKRRSPADKARLREYLKTNYGA